MGMTKIKALRYGCDGCGSQQLVEDEVDVIGYSGQVFWRHVNGGDSADWFACGIECVRSAIGNALEDRENEK